MGTGDVVSTAASKSIALIVFRLSKVLNKHTVFLCNGTYSDRVPWPAGNIGKQKVNIVISQVTSIVQ